MTNIHLPTPDNDIVLVSHGTTVTIQRNHSSVEEYAVESTPYGNRTTDWTREEVETKIKELLQKGWEVAK